MKKIYIAAYCFLAVILLKALSFFILNSPFEQDLLWFVPAVLREGAGLSPGRLLIYLLRPWPMWFEVASLKVYVFSVLSVFGPQAGHLISASIAIHFINSILLYHLGRRLRLSSGAAALACFMYLSYFAHFHAYMWPMAFQHIIVVCFVLLGLNLYLKAEEAAAAGGNCRPWLRASFVTGIAASFCRVSVLILPIVIFADILFAAANDKERIARYNRWLPVFAIYLGYPLFTIATGDGRVQTLMRPLASMLGRSTDLVSAGSLWGASARYLGLLLICAAGLFIVKWFLAIFQRKGAKQVFKWAAITAAVSCLVIIVLAGGAKRLLIPYNILAPFAGGLASFLNPINSALSIDSTRPYYFIPLQLTVFWFILSIVIIVIFIKKFVLKNKLLFIPVCLYLVGIVYLYLRDPMPSRYFIYITPSISIVFCSVLDLMFNKISIKKAAAAIIFIALCVPNIIAIKTALFYGRLTNTFYTYDYIRAADLIREDIAGNNQTAAIKSRGVAIRNAQSIVFSTQGAFMAHDLYNDNARFTVAQTLGLRHTDVVINDETHMHKSPVGFILVNGYAINDEHGANIDKFSVKLEMAMDHLRHDRYEQAESALLEAVKEKPFLLNYILSGMPLEDATRLTQGRDVRDWIYDISTRYAAVTSGPEMERNRGMAGIMELETDEYIRCLFFLSYLRHRQGDPGRSRFWFSQIRFLEHDYRDVGLILSTDQLYFSNNAARAVFEKYENTDLFLQEDNYSDRYRFARFIFRLMAKI